RVGAHVGEVLGERADIRSDRHLVIVEYDDKAPVGVPGVVERLESHATGHRAIAYHGYDMVVFALEVTGDRHAVGRRDGSGCVARAESVVLALVPGQKAAEAPVLADGVEAFEPPGEYL